MKKLKVAVFGAGAIARASHIPGYAANENCELTAIADVSPESLAGVREKWHFEREYNDCSALLAHEKTGSCLHLSPQQISRAVRD